MWQVNYLGHWLLAHELFSHQRSRFQSSSKSLSCSDRAHRGAESRSEQANSVNEKDENGTRLIFLSSMTHRAGKLEFSDLQLTHGYSGFKGYANSKLATLLAAKEFQRRFDRCQFCPMYLPRLLSLKRLYRFMQACKCASQLTTCCKE